MKKYKKVLFISCGLIVFFIVYGLFFSDSSYTEKFLGKMDICETFKIINDNNKSNDKVYEYKKFIDEVYPHEIIYIKRSFNTKEYIELTEKKYTYTGYSINLYAKDSFIGNIKIYTALQENEKQKILMIYNEQICFYPKSFKNLISNIN